MKQFSQWFVPVLAILFLASCERPEPEPSPTDSITPDSGKALILNEGVWGGNNASLSFLDLSSGSLVNHWFRNSNNRNLGDVAQDLVVYGTKAYVVVWNSNSLEVVDTATGTATHVDLGNRGPRYFAAYEGKLYVSCYNPHSVIRIDTATLTIDGTCPLGDYNPEGIAAVRGMLLVASSNISNEQGVYSYHDKLFVIKVSTFSSIGVISVGCNPQKVMAVDSVTAVVNYWGDYANEPGGAALIDMQTLQVQQLGVELTNMTVASGSIYGYSTQWAPDYSSKSTTFVRIDVGESYSITPILGSVDFSAYAIGVHPTSGNVYVATDGDYSANGDLYCFTPDGVRRWKREVGMLPSKIVFF